MLAPMSLETTGVISGSFLAQEGPIACSEYFPF